MNETLYTWSEEALESSYMRGLIQKYGMYFGVSTSDDSFITGKLVQTTIPEWVNGPGKWLSACWVKRA